MASRNFYIGIFDSKVFKIFEYLIVIITFFLTVVVAVFSYPVNALILTFFLTLSSVLIFVSVSTYIWFSKNRIPISNRFDFTNRDLKKNIDNSTESIRILCIFLTWSKKIIPWIFDKLKKDENVKIELLLVKRKRKPDDVSFIRLRENDELKCQRYVPEINTTLWDLFASLFDMYLQKKKNIRNLEVKEYEFMPCLCMYIFDNRKLVFGPYIAKECDTIPMMELNSFPGAETIAPENCVAFSELMKHYNVLSGRGKYRRGNKDYPFRFCYYDGLCNIPVHLMIENNASQLLDILTPQKRVEYLNFLIGGNDTFEDGFMSDLHEDRNEGRFDALLRYLSDRLVVSRQNPPDPDKWLDELLTIAGMARSSAVHAFEGRDEFHHSKRLADLSMRLKIIEDQSAGITIEPDWVLLIKDLRKACDDYTKSQKNVDWITELQVKIIRKWEDRLVRQVPASPPTGP